MRTIRNPNPLPDPARDEPEGRRYGRVRCDYLYCCHGKKRFGQVLDLSRSGMRLIRRGLRVPRGVHTELILCWNQARVPVWVRVTWEQKIGWFTYLLGLQFIEMTPDTTAIIQSLASKAQSSLLIASVEHDFAGAASSEQANSKVFGPLDR